MVWSIFKVRFDDFCSYLVYLHFCRFDIGEDEEIPNLNAQEVPQPQVQSTLSSVLGDHSQAPTNPLTSSAHPEDPLGGVFLFPKLKCSFFFNSIINLDGYHIHPLPFFFSFFLFSMRECVYHKFCMILWKCWWMPKFIFLLHLYFDMQPMLKTLVSFLLLLVYVVQLWNLTAYYVIIYKQGK